MNWSWRIGRIGGIDVYMHWTFLILLGWIAGMHLWAGLGWQGALQGVGFILAIFGCVVLHEFGHAACARRYGIGTHDITLLPIGGVARLERMPEEPEQEFWIALAGPAVNVAIAAVLAVLLFLSWGLPIFFSVPVIEARFLLRTPFFLNLLWVNLVLVVFNLLPAFPMDGGRVLRALLAMRLDYLQATWIAARVGQAMAIGFAVLGFVWTPWLFLIAIFVFLGAEAEAQATRTRSIISGVRVWQGMMTRFRTLAPDDTLRRAAEELLAGSQQDFPVVDEHGAHGILERKNLVEGLNRLGPDGAVADAMRPLPRAMAEDEMLDEALQFLREQDHSSLPVFRDGALVGLLSMENITELMMLRSVRLGGPLPDEEIQRAA